MFVFTPKRGSPICQTTRTPDFSDNAPRELFLTTFENFKVKKRLIKQTTVTTPELYYSKQHRSRIKVDCQ